MCLTTIKKILKHDDSKTVTGYKAVYRYKKEKNQPVRYGPIYLNREDRWKTNVWYKPNYVCARFSMKNKNTKLLRTGKYADIIKKCIKKSILNSSIRILTNGNYPCGFHFFSTKKDVQTYRSMEGLIKEKRAIYYHENIVYIKCEFKNIIAFGEQWNSDSKVARKMKIIEEVPRSKIRATPY